MYELPLVGMVSGLLLGTTGVGAGAVMLGLLILIGFTIKQAIASSLLIQLIPITIVAVYLYHKEGHLRIKDTLWIAVFAFIGTTIGAWVVSKNWVKAGYIELMVGTLTIALGIYMLYCGYKHI